MKKDIPFERVEDIAVAVVPEVDDAGITDWRVYILNMKPYPIEGIIVASTGYGELEGKKIRTSTLRQLFDKIDANAFVPVELIPEDLRSISNEFWVSFWENGKLLDKQFVFVAESIAGENMVTVPLIGKKGVMIR